MPQIVKGSYTSNGAARTLDLVLSPDTLELYIQGNAAGDNWDSTANPGVTKYARWFKGMTNGSAFTIRNTNGAATDQADFLTANGFTFFDQGDLATIATTAIVSVSQANPAVVTSNAHGLATGDLVRLCNVTNMQQISSLVFSVTVTGANTFTIPIDTSGFAAAGAGGTVRKLQAGPLFTPNEIAITGITAANPAVISTARNHGYAVGAKFRVYIPDDFGMIQFNGLIAQATAVTATTITTDIDSSAFTAFAYPTSAVAAAGVSFPQIVPVGEVPTILTESIDNTGVIGVSLGTAIVGPNGAKVFWVATKADAIDDQ